jgi:hypothetical protein
MDSFITALILLVVSALATWMKKKAGAPPDPEDASPGQPPVNQPRPTARPASWEEELRRLLEGQSPTAPPRPMQPPPMRPAPPPMARQQPRQTPPAPPAVIRPVLIPPEVRPVLSPPRSMPTPAAVGASIEVSAGRMAPLTQSKEAYERASQLDKSVAAHIDRVPGQRVLATNVIRRAASPEIVQVVSMFKNARAARQAVLASVILGPPRSLEELSPGY